MINRSLDGRVCESFYAKDILLALQALKKISSMAELRYDLSNLNRLDLKSIKKASDKKLIFTCRGGVFSEERILAAYKMDIDSGYDYIDIDLEHDGHLLPMLQSRLSDMSTQLILSYHNYHETPKAQDLDLIIKNLSSSQPDLIKIATLTRTPEDVDLLIGTQSKFENTICLGMGSCATESRIRSLRNGGAFTFVAFDVSKSTAQGQIDFKGFQKAYLDFRGGEQMKLAVIGNPISHSKSPDLFEEFFEQDKIKGVYEKIELKHISEFELLKTHYDGFNVTSPFKQSIISLLDHLSAAARLIGAVNTVYKKNEQWVGDNTDHLGIVQSIEQEVNLSNINQCIILGAGGAARAAAYAMKIKGIKTSIGNRTLANAKELALEFSHQINKNTEISGYDLIINTIPDPFSLIDPGQLHSGQFILDAIYPLSEFTSLEKMKGFKLIHGENWLRQQAKAAYSLFQDGSNTTF